MPRQRLRHIALALGADGLAVFVAYGLFYTLRFRLGLMPAPRFVPVELASSALATALFWVAVFALFGLYRERSLRRWGWAETLRLARALGVGILLLFFVLFIDTLRPGAARLTIPIYGLSLFGVVWTARWALYRLTRTALGGVGLTRLAIVGERSRAEYVAGLLQSQPELGYRPVVVVAFDAAGREAPRLVFTSRLLSQPGFVSQSARLDSPAQLADTVQHAVAENVAEEVLVLLTPRDIAYYLELVRVCSRLSVPLRFVSNYRPILPDEAPEAPLAHLMLPPHLAG